MFLLFKYCKLCLIFFHLSSAILRNENFEYGSKYDLPTKAEVQLFVKVLQNITNFYLESADKILISVAFGVFIGNVHLGRAMKDFKNTPLSIQNDITDIYKKSEDILIYYQWNIANRKSATECLKISKLFNNVSAWIDSLEEFKQPREMYRVSGDLSQVYRSWRRYSQVAHVRHSHHWTPTPTQSDTCLKSLAADDRSTDLQTCNIDPGCRQILKYGSDISYALCHRALILLMAQNSRGCSIFSPREDRKLLDDFCTMGFAEAKYIAYHNYGLVDLLLEYISLCALAGRTEFLRRSWLSDVLKFQTRHGCFSQDIQESAEQLQMRSNDINNDLLGGQCSGHTTALATSALSAAVRFILESPTK